MPVDGGEETNEVTHIHTPCHLLSHDLLFRVSHISHSTQPNPTCFLSKRSSATRRHRTIRICQGSTMEVQHIFSVPTRRSIPGPDTLFCSNACMHVSIRFIRAKRLHPRRTHAHIPSLSPALSLLPLLPHIIPTIVCGPIHRFQDNYAACGWCILRIDV